MPMRRKIIVGLALAVVVSAVTVTAIVASRPDPACGCSIEPNLRGPATDAAVRFEELVRRADVSGAWALLTDGARSRYVDVAGFQPVFDRLGKVFQEVGAGADRAASSWLVVDERARYSTPSEVVAVRYSANPPRVVWPLLILVPIGQLGGERIDPEVPALPLTAVGDGDGARVELSEGDPDRTSFVVIDGAGQQRLPGRERVTERVNRLTWSRPLLGPVVVIAIEKSSTGLRVGSAPVTG
jgi:hypothetical protein